MAGRRRGHPYPPAFDDAKAYDRFMGRYSVLLAPQLADLAGVSAGQLALDVGCGTGALTAELARRLGPESVTAIDPSEPFVAAVRERHPDVSARVGRGEELPFEDDAFDAALAQLSVTFMRDPSRGLAEMARVTRAGGMIAVVDWVPRLQSPLQPFSRSVPATDRPYRRRRPGRDGSANVLRELGLRDVERLELHADVRYERFEDWWLPLTEGVGPSATYAKSLDPDARAHLRDRCEARLTAGPFTIEAVALATRAAVP
jgi:SAM-dependent methyltransferase